MLQGMDLIFRNLFFNKTIVFTYPNASNSHIFQYRGGDLKMYSSHPIKPTVM